MHALHENDMFGGLLKELGNTLMAFLESFGYLLVFEKGVFDGAVIPHTWTQKWKIYGRLVFVLAGLMLVQHTLVS